MARTKLGQVTNDERNAIRRLHERRTALKELLLTLGSPDLSHAERDALKTGIDEDLARTTALFDGWWQEVGTKYQLERAEHGKWMLDFETRELWREPPTGQTCQACAPKGSDGC